MHPLVDAERVLGGFHTPTDGLAKAPRAVAAQLARAADRGARLLGNHRVLDVLAERGRVTGVRHRPRRRRRPTSSSPPPGSGGRRRAHWSDLTIPLLPMAHQYVTTTPVAALAGRNTDLAEAGAPILRHQDRDLYFREHVDRVGIGSYAHRPMPVDLDALPRRRACPASSPSPPRTSRRPGPTPASCCRRCVLPRIEHGFNGIFSFTPDGMPLIGEHPELAGFWVAEAVWVTHSCGVGQALARLAGGRRSRASTCTNATSTGSRRHSSRRPTSGPAARRTSSRSTTSCIRWSRRSSRGRCGSARSTRARWSSGRCSSRPPAGSGRTGSRPTPVCRRSPASPQRGEWAVAVLVADRRGRGARHPRARGAVRHDPAQTAGGQRPRCAGAAAAAHHQQPRQEAGRGDVHAAAGTVRRRAQRPHRRAAGRAALPGRRQRQPRPRLAHPRRRPTTSSSATSPAATCCIGLWGPRARDVVAPVTSDDVSHAGFGYFRARRIHRGRRARHRDAAVVRRRAGLGALHERRARAAAVGRAVGGRAAPRRDRRRAAAPSTRCAWRRATARWRRHDHRARPVRSRARLRGARQGDFVGKLRDRRARDSARRLVPLLLDDPAHVVMGKEPVSASPARRPGTSPAPRTDTRSMRASPTRGCRRPLPSPARRCTSSTSASDYRRSVAAEPLFDPEMKRIRT